MAWWDVTKENAPFLDPTVTPKWITDLVPSAKVVSDSGPNGTQQFFNGVKVYEGISEAELRKLMALPNAPDMVITGLWNDPYLVHPTGGGGYTKTKAGTYGGSYLNALLQTGGMIGAAYGLGGLNSALAGLGTAAVTGAAGVAGAVEGAGGFTASELANLGLTASDFMPGAGGILTEAAAGGVGALAGATVSDLVLQGIPYQEAVNIVGAGGTGAAGTIGGGTVADAAASSGVSVAEKTAQLTTDAAKGFFANWKPQDYLAATSLGLTGAATIAALANGGNETTSATSTTTPTGPGTNLMPGTTTGETAGENAFDVFIKDFYGLSADGKSVAQRTAEDVATQKAAESTFTTSLADLNASHLANTTAAVSPYQKQLSDALLQSQTKTGAFTPMNLTTSTGGVQAPFTSFVPKPQLNTLDAALGVGRTGANVSTALEDLGYGADTQAISNALQFASAHPANEAANTYSAKLEELMKYLNPNTGQTSSATGTVPGTPWYSTLLQGLTTGTNLFNSIYNPRQANNDALLNALAAKALTG